MNGPGCDSRQPTRAVDLVAELDIGVVTEDQVEAGDGSGKVDERATCDTVSVEGRHTKVGDGDEQVSTCCRGRITGRHRCRDGVGWHDRAEAAREHQRRCLRVRIPDHRDLEPASFEDHKILGACQVVVPVLQVGRDVAERLTQHLNGARYSARKIDHRLEVCNPPIEVVVPERVDIEAYEPQRLHSRYFLQEVRKWR